MSFWNMPEWRAYLRLAEPSSIWLERDRPRPQPINAIPEPGWPTRVLDLQQPEADLWSGLRKSYKSIIRRAEREYWISRAPSSAIDAFRAMHRHEAGRETRPCETWAMMARWVERGDLWLFGARPHDTGALVPQRPNGHAVDSSSGQDRAASTTFDGYVAFAAFYVWPGWAYYGHSAAIRPNVAHALIWNAIVALRAAGTPYLELGWQGVATDQKGQQIEFFKRGFGGSDWWQSA